jgi:hypothetical protein
MPKRTTPNRAVLLCLLAAAVTFAGIASLAGAAPAARPLGAVWSVKQIRSNATERANVSVRGRIVSARDSRLFTIEDEWGDRIVVRIPDFLQRDSGKPKMGEAIHVTGMYTHKTFLDVGRKKSGKSDDLKTWGIRVSELARNVQLGGRNLHLPDEPKAQKSHGGTNARNTTPAAPAGLATVGTPNAPKALKVRMSSARQRVIRARTDLETANMEFNRAGEQSGNTALADRQASAQREYTAAIDAIPSLVEEARAEGIAPQVIDLYEAGITKPSR